MGSNSCRMTSSDGGCSQPYLEGANRKRHNEFSDQSPNSPSSKRQKSRPPYLDDLRLNDMLNHCDTAVTSTSTFRSDPPDDDHPPMHYEGSNLNTKGSKTSNPASDPPSTNLSSTTSPSSTLSPLFSPASSSTMISNLSTLHEEKNIPPSTLPDNNLSISSLHVEIATSYESSELPGTHPSARIPGQGPLEPYIRPFQPMSTAAITGEAAGKIPYARPQPTPPTPTEVAVDRKPTGFVDLTEDIQCTIFEEVLVRPHRIFPTYRCGMLVEGPWSATSDNDTMDGGVSTLENIDLALFQVNKYFNQKCCEIFYGRNEFVFDRPDVCRWWIKHIGLKNLSLLRSLGLAFYWGFLHPADKGRSTFDLSEEELWRSVLCWMQNRHRLEFLSIEFRGLRDLEWAWKLTDQEEEELGWHRLEIMSVLLRFRGIEAVQISCRDCRWLTSGEMQRLGLLMQQRRERVVEKGNEPSLSQLINSLRLEREEREEEERWQRRQWEVDYGY